MTTTQTVTSPIRPGLLATSMTTAIDVADALCARDWTRKWDSYNTVTDEIGNIAHMTDTEECVLVEFEWAAPGGVVDALRMCATRPVPHIIAVVEALAMPPEV